MTKKRSILIILFVFFAALYNAVASDIYDLRDLTTESPQFVDLYPKDFVKFEYFNGTHIVQIEKVLNDKEVNIIIFTYKQNGTYLTIGNGRSAHMDINQDLTDDISINLFDLEGNLTTLKFDRLEKDPNIVVPPQFNLNNNSIQDSNKAPAQNNKSNPLVGISIIITAIILGIVIIKLFKKNKK